MTTALKPNANKLLKREIDNRGMKVKFVADKIGVSPAYLGQVLNGSRTLSANIAMKASHEIGVSLDIFLK